MAKILTETASWSGSETVTVPEDGDGVTGLSVETAVKPIANRTQHLRSIVEGTGVQRIAEVLGLAELKAITGMSDGDRRMVWGLGGYRYTAGLSDSEAVPWVLVPDDGSAGRWVHDSGALPGMYLAEIDFESGIIKQPVPNRISTYQLQRYGDTVIITSYALAATWMTDTLAQHTYAVDTNDVLEIEASMLLYAAGGKTVKAALGIEHPSSTHTIIDDSIREVSGSTPTRVYLRTIFKPGVNASVKIGLYAHPSTGGPPDYDAYLKGPGYFALKVIRP